MSVDPDKENRIINTATIIPRYKLRVLKTGLDFVRLGIVFIVFGFLLIRHNAQLKGWKTL